jgi:alkyldihydroxyacetonephosphate synthase
VIEGLEARLAAIVGAEHVLVGEPARRAHTGDMSWISIAAAAADSALSRQDALVSPGSTEEVAAVLRLANEHRIPVTPLGGGSGVQGAANADRGGLVLSLKRMNRIRHTDERSLTCEVEAGVVTRTFESWLNERGLTFTHYPASAEWATIGGAIAARGSGVLSSKYGKIEDHVLSLEVALPTGDVVRRSRNCSSAARARSGS